MLALATAICFTVFLAVTLVSCGSDDVSNDMRSRSEAEHLGRELDLPPGSALIRSVPGRDDFGFLYRVSSGTDIAKEFEQRDLGIDANRGGEVAYFRVGRPSIDRTCSVLVFDDTSDVVASNLRPGDIHSGQQAFFIGIECLNPRPM